MSVALAMVGAKWVIGDYHNNKMNDCFAFETIADIDEDGNPVMNEQIQPLIPYGFWGNQPRMKIDFKEEETRMIKTVEMIALTQPDYAEWLKNYYNGVVGKVIIT
jgi:hypothetical protein